MYVIAILDKKEKKEIGLITRAKNIIIKKIKQKLIDILCVKQNGLFV